jgi:hypothetical protein
MRQLIYFTATPLSGEEKQQQDHDSHQKKKGKLINGFD